MNTTTFWTNSVWYISLGIISLLLFSYVLMKSKARKRDFGFFWAVFGFTLFIETIVYIFLRAYEYYPLIIPDSPKNDGVVGNIISQFSISTVALYICVFKIRTKGIIAAAASFSLVEELFLALGIYQHFWYRSWITFIGLFTILHIIKNWHYKVPVSKSKLLRYITIIVGAVALYLPTTNWIGILTGFFDIRDDLLIDPFISHAVIAIPKYLIMINLVYFLVMKNSRRIWHIFVIVIVFLGDAVLNYTRLMHVRDGWLLVYSMLSLSTAYLFIYIMNMLLYRGSKKNKSR